MSTARDFDRMVMQFMRDDPLTATYIKQLPGVFNSTTGENTTSTVEIPVRGIQLDMVLTRNGQSTEDNKMIRQGDKQFFMQPPEKTDPLAIPLVINEASDTIRIGTKTYNIVTAKEINPSGSNVILYEIYLRK